MDYKSIVNHLENMSSDNVLKLCGIVYDWKHNNENMHETTIVKNIGKELNYNTKDIENMLLKALYEVAPRKLEKLVLLLIEECPYVFFKTAKN